MGVFVSLISTLTKVVVAFRMKVLQVFKKVSKKSHVITNAKTRLWKLSRNMENTWVTLSHELIEF